MTYKNQETLYINYNILNALFYLYIFLINIVNIDYLQSSSYMLFIILVNIKKHSH